MVIFASQRDHMLPEEFLNRIASQSYIDAPRLAEALGQPAHVSIRINPAKWDQPVSGYEGVPWEPMGFYLPVRPQFTPDPLFHAGVYYPQEASSMFTGEAFRQITYGMEGLRVLDLCGAPGGKSTHLASLIDDNGVLVANEVIRARASVLAENITKWGTGNAIVTQNDPSDFVHLQGFFDVIVVDAPCSGEGMFREQVAVNEWSEHNTRLCSERQRRIVMDAWPSLKPGGMMIYSTCTFNPHENEENIAWLHDRTDSESVPLDITDMDGIITIRKGDIEGYGFHPGRVKGDGFFIAVIRKTGGDIPGKKTKKTKLPKPSLRALDTIKPLLSIQPDRLLLTNDRIMALACDRELFSYISARLTVVKSGTLIGEYRNKDFIPAHDLAMSVRQHEGAWPAYDASYDEAIAFLRLDNFVISAMPIGRIQIRYRGVSLGFINNLGNRINNNYPHGWRVRMEKQNYYKEIL